MPSFQATRLHCKKNNNKLELIYFSSESWEKNKRYAEQAAALVATICLGLANQNLQSANSSQQETNQKHPAKNLSINETESMNGGQYTPHQANGVNTSNSNIKHFKSDDSGDLNQDVWRIMIYLFSFLHFSISLYTKVELLSC